MDELKEKLLKDIVSDLSDNYDGDEPVLKTLLDDIIANAFFISNRVKTENNLKLLSYEIKKCVKTIYQQRGVEDVKSLTESGRNSVYQDALDNLRKDIVQNGKRVMY